MFVPVHSCAPIRALSRIVLSLLATCFSATDVVAATFTVNSPADVVDANPGDGICRTAPDNTVCTLRAAIMEANVLPGPDTINLQASVTYMLTRVGVDEAGINGDLDVFDSVTIVGAGPASTIIDGNGNVTGDRVMQIARCIGGAPPVNGLCSGGTNVVVQISGVAFRHGHVTGGGGGILSEGILTLENCAITDNTVDAGTSAAGGGIFSVGSLTLSNSIVTNNTLGLQSAGGGGAGICSLGPTTIINSTVSENVAAPNAYGGGLAMFSSVTGTVVASTFSGNHAHAGGGVSANGSTLNLINTTISGNFSEGSGGGLYVDGGTVGLYNVTVAANQANADAAGADIGGGLFNTGASVTVANSILTNNYYRNEGSPFDTLDECSGALTMQGDKNNIVTFVVAAHCAISGTYKSEGASLGALQNNGGPTPTHALLVGSKAIDAGNLSGCTDNLGAFITTDQRGVHRPNGAACDLGAYEFDDIIFQNGFNP